MPSLGIAPGSEGCAGQPNESDAEPAPVSGVFPVDVNLHLLEIGLQAIQLSPYHAGLPAHRPQRLDPATGFLACSCPLHLSVPGQPSDPEIFLRIPPNSIGDTTGRLVAHFVRSTRPFDAGSRAGSSRMRVASDPANAAAGALTFPVPPIADSRSQTSVLLTAPTAAMSCHIPASRSPAWREGSIIAAM